MAIYLSDPQTCAKAIEAGLWLCGLPAIGKVNPAPGKKELFEPFIESAPRLKPIPSNVQLDKLAELYREIIKRIIVDDEHIEVLASDLRLKLQKLKPQAQ